MVIKDKEAEFAQLKEKISNLYKIKVIINLLKFLFSKNFSKRLIFFILVMKKFPLAF